MRYGENLVRQVRSMMEPGNPAPRGTAVGHWQDPQGAQIRERVLAQARGTAAGTERDRYPDWADDPASLFARQNGSGRRQQYRPRSRRRLAWRLAAPAAAALAVAGLITGLTLAHQPPSAGPAAAASQALPRFYVTISDHPTQSSSGWLAIVHDSRTGRELGTAEIPGGGSFPNITAGRSGRVFVVQERFSLDSARQRLYLLHVSATGQVTARRLPEIIDVGLYGDVTGVALSPSGTELAATADTSAGGVTAKSYGEVLVLSLTGGPVQTWTAPGDSSEASDPVWTGGDRFVTFLWQDHLRGTGPIVHTTPGQVRVLDTAAASRDILTSRILRTGGGAFGDIQYALAGPGDSPVLALTSRDIPAGHGSGTTILRLAILSPAGKVLETRHLRTFHYRNGVQKLDFESDCMLDSIDYSGQHTLAQCPVTKESGLGWYSSRGAFSRVPVSYLFGGWTAAAW